MIITGAITANSTTAAPFRALAFRCLRKFVFEQIRD